jgi:signal transduction histidine kinase
MVGAPPGQIPASDGKSDIAAARAAWIEIKVSDTGIGIPPDKLEVIFEKFRQLDSSTTRLYGGLGLGLFIVQQLTEILGGKITVESELDHGSTFTVTIPVGT